jgi:hypothetical protein
MDVTVPRASEATGLVSDADVDVEVAGVLVPLTCLFTL